MIFMKDERLPYLMGGGVTDLHTHDHQVPVGWALTYVHCIARH